MIDLELPRRTNPEINLSALIDIMFILVIFIVLAATFDRVRAVDVELPSSNAPNRVDDKALVVTIPRDGPLRLGDRIVDLDHVRAELQRERTAHSTVVLLADRDANVQRAVQVLTDAQAAGFTSVSIATRDPGKSVP